MRSLRILRLYWKRKWRRPLQLIMVALVLLAMSKITLQRGVETTLKHYVPEVQSIVGEDDTDAAEQGYKPFVPKDPRDL